MKSLYLAAALLFFAACADKKEDRESYKEDHISFGMTALVVILALGAYLNAGTDVIDIEKPGEQPDAGN